MDTCKCGIAQVDCEYHRDAPVTPTAERVSTDLAIGNREARLREMRLSLSPTAQLIARPDGRCEIQGRHCGDARCALFHGAGP